MPLLSLPHGARRAVAAVAVLGAGLVATSTPAAAPPSLEVVTDGLANPRGLTVGPGGQIYVAEAGSGGTSPCIAGPEGAEVCYGATGAITKVDPGSGDKKQVVSGLPSLAEQDAESPGGDAIGPQDISFGQRAGYFTVGLGADPAARTAFGDAADELASLFRLGHHGVKKIADLGDYEAENNPDGGDPAQGGVDTNPFSVDATGRQILVSDAGGNDLLGVSKTRGHEIVTLATFAGGMAPFPDLGPMAPPNSPPPGTPIPYQAVPTGVVRGPDGAAYLGQLTGFPFPVGAANVYRVAGQGEPEVIASGFTNIVDIGYHAGNGYVLQISAAGLLSGQPAGALFQVAPDGTKTELVPGQLTQPTGMTIAANGDIYVSNNGGSPTDGEVVRIRAASGDHGGTGHGGEKHRKHRR